MKVAGSSEEKVWPPNSIEESGRNGKNVVQDQGGDSLVSNRPSLQPPELTSEIDIGMAVTVGLAGTLLQGTIRGKETLVAVTGRFHAQEEVIVVDVKAQQSSGCDHNSAPNESERHGSASNKSDPA